MKKVGLWGCAGGGAGGERERVPRRIDDAGRERGGGGRRWRRRWREGKTGRGVQAGSRNRGEEGGGVRTRGRRERRPRRERRVDGIAGHYSETRICSFVSSLCMRRGVCASFYRLKSRLRITVQMIFFFECALALVHPLARSPLPPLPHACQPLRSRLFPPDFLAATLFCIAPRTRAFAPTRAFWTQKEFKTAAAATAAAAAAAAPWDDASGNKRKKWEFPDSRVIRGICVTWVPIRELRDTLGDDNALDRSYQSASEHLIEYLVPGFADSDTYEACQNFFFTETMVHLEIEDIKEIEEVGDTQISVETKYILSFFYNTLKLCDKN